MRHLLFLTVLFCIGYVGSSQSLYELKYHFITKSGRTNYKALLLRNGDGTGTIRVEFYDLRYKARNLYDIQMVETYGEHDNGTQDRNTLIYVGMENPVRVLGNAKYDPDHFVFKRDRKTGFFEPDYVLSIHSNGQEELGVLDKIKLLKDEDLSPDFMLQYYTQEDEVFLNFFDEAETRGPTQQEKQAQLHLVIVADTEDEKIGNSCMVDKNSTYKAFSEVAEYLKIKFRATVIFGKNFNKVNVEKAVNNLSPGNNDIVVFYYSGHGFNDVKSSANYPYLDLRDKSYQPVAITGPHTMNIATIYNKIKAKGARLNIVISDCCNSDPSSTSNISSDPNDTRTSSIGWNMNNCKALFMNQQRLSILVTAAAKGELSAGNSNKGGIFTFNLRESLEKNMGPFANNVTWSSLVANARKQTITSAKRTGCRQEDNSLRSCVQNPMYSISK